MHFHPLHLLFLIETNFSLMSLTSFQPFKWRMYFPLTFLPQNLEVVYMFPFTSIFFLVSSSEIKSGKCHPIFSYHLHFTTPVHRLGRTKIPPYKDNPASVSAAGEGRALCLACQLGRASSGKEVVSYVKKLFGNQNDFWVEWKLKCVSMSFSITSRTSFWD